MGRLNHLQETLPKNLYGNQGFEGLEFVLLDYSSRDGLAGWIKARFMPEIKSGLLVYYRAEGYQRFFMAHAKNCAHRLAHGEIVVNVDADTFVLPEYGQALREYLETSMRNIVRLVPPDRSQFSLCGRIALPRQEFIRLGGYNENLQGYGFEDTNLLERAQRLGLETIQLSHAFGACLEHSDAERTLNYSNKSTLEGRETNLKIAREELRNGFYANAGRVWGDLERDPYNLP